MKTLTFSPTYIRFNNATRAVHVTADCDGNNVDILIGRAVIEYLAGARELNKDQCFTTVVKHKEQLQFAAEIALARYGNDCRALAIELSDLKLIVSPAPATTSGIKRI
jgi:hypothetical protein